MPTDLREALLADVIENPADDAPRLILADWLEDNDDPQRAEFIRLQCGLAGPDPCRMPGKCLYGPGAPPEKAGRPVWFCGEMACVGRFHLRRRERDLLRANITSAVGEAPEGQVWHLGSSSKPELLLHVVGVRPSFGVGTLRRGFVAHVSCTQAGWLKCGPALVRSCPLEGVRLADREPSTSGGFTGKGGASYTARWTQGYPPHEPRRHVLADEFFPVLSRGGFQGQHPTLPWWFLSPAEANAALGEIALAWAREQAAPCNAGQGPS